MREFKAYKPSEFEAFIKDVKVNRAINHVQIHHTWKPRISDYKGEETIRAVYEYHTKERGWQDIGEHFTIGPDGLTWDGRDLSINPAGISGHNTGGIMIEMVGNFDKGEDTLEDKQLEAVIIVVRALLNRFNLTEKDIVFHREHADKTCPGSGIDKAWFIDLIKTYGKLESIELTAYPTVIIDERYDERYDALLIDGVTYAPIRKIAEASCRKVGWDGKHVFLRK